MIIAPHTKTHFYELFVFDQDEKCIRFQIREIETDESVFFTSIDEPKFKRLITAKTWNYVADIILQFSFKFHKERLSRFLR